MKRFENIGHFLLKSGILIVVVIFFSRCIDDPEIPDPEAQDQHIMEYIEYNSDTYSEFNEVLIKTNLTHLLRTRGPYTLFLPDNEAMQKYYQKKGVSSADNLDEDFLHQLVLNHLISIEIYSSDIGLGSLPKTNAIGDYLVTEFDESEILINKESVITDRDIVVANGIIHRIGTVIDVVINDAFYIISNDPQFSIFTEALEKTGISDTLQVVEIPYGKINARVRYTILAVPDSVYQNEGINSFDDLVEQYGEGTDYSNPENKLYQYIDYHCLEGTYYLTSFKSNTIYYTISRENQVTMRITNDYMINYVDSTKEYTGFIIPDANYPAKNGVVHAINGTLPPADPKTGVYIFQTTDYPDLHIQECYRESYIHNFYNEDEFENIKWGGGDYLQFYDKSDNIFIDNDCLSMSDSYWWLELKLPKIRKGKYEITGYFKTGNNRANVVPYLDGVKYDIILLNDKDNGQNFAFVELPIATVDWDKTEEHYFMFKAIYPGIIYWDYLKFTPIE